MKTATKHELKQKRRDSTEKRHLVRLFILVALIAASICFEMTGYFGGNDEQSIQTNR